MSSPETSQYLETPTGSPVPEESHVAIALLEGLHSQEQVQVALLRELEPRDLPTLLEWFHHPNIREHFASTPHTVEELGQEYAEPGNHNYIAENTLGEVVGVFTFRDNLSAGSRNGHLERVAIAPHLQNKGIGSQMVRQALEIAFSAQEHNYYKVNLGVVTDIKDWERTKHVYEKMGFGEVGVWRKHVVTQVEHLTQPPQEVLPSQQVRMVSTGYELITVKDAVWMDLLQSEWKEMNAK